MTKTDFSALADTLRATKPAAPERETGVRYDIQLAKLIQWEQDRDALADLCAKSNPAFRRGQWFDYIAGKCGPSGGAIRENAPKAISNHVTEWNEKGGKV